MNVSYEEIRNPKNQIRNKSKIRKREIPNLAEFGFGFRSFGFVSDFSFRISDLLYLSGVSWLWSNRGSSQTQWKPAFVLSQTVRSSSTSTPVTLMENASGPRFCSDCPRCPRILPSCVDVHRRF